MIAGRQTMMPADVTSRRLAVNNIPEKILKLRRQVATWPPGPPVLYLRDLPKCKTIIDTLCTYECRWCHGVGHFQNRCATKWAVYHEAKAAGVTWDMGALKGLCWEPHDGRDIYAELDSLRAQLS